MNLQDLSDNILPFFHAVSYAAKYADHTGTATVSRNELLSIIMDTKTALGFPSIHSRCDDE